MAILLVWFDFGDHQYFCPRIFQIPEWEWLNCRVRDEEFGENGRPEGSAPDRLRCWSNLKRELDDEDASEAHEKFVHSAMIVFNGDRSAWRQDCRLGRTGHWGGYRGDCHSIEKRRTAQPSGHGYDRRCGRADNSWWSRSVHKIGIEH